MRLSAGEIAAATGGEVATGSVESVATSFAIDSRVLEPGACFVALRGGRDGHDFVADAAARGATVALVGRVVDAPAVTQIRVEDPLGALGALGALARTRLGDSVVVGITGSAGKTATKDLTAAALGAARRVHASPGSYNNEAGLPLTLLAAEPGVDAIVVEMGARFPGNIQELCALARPSLGVVTHIGLAHAGTLGGRAGIARVKGELLDALPPDGLAVLNADDDHSGPLAVRSTARALFVGFAHDADVRTTLLDVDDELRPVFLLETPWGAAEVRLTVRGEHQVVNAAMGAAVALELGVPLEAVAAGLATARGAAFRMELLRTVHGVTLLNDAYNASPTATAAALRALANLRTDGRRVAVLGDMLELGDHADAEHLAVGELAASAGVDLLVAVGERAELIAAAAAEAGVDHVVTAADAAVAAEVVAAHVGTGDAVLLKASRAVGLERVADVLGGEEHAR